MKIFSAEIKEGIIYADGLPVVDCPVIGQGGDSKGIIVMSGFDLAYIPNTTPDNATNIDIMIEALNSVISTFNAISSGVLASNGGGAITTGGFTSGISSGVDALNQSISKLNQLKQVLK